MVLDMRIAVILLASSMPFAAEARSSRLTCAVTLESGVSFAGCTDGATLSVTRGTTTLLVQRDGARIAFRVSDRQTGEEWPGVGTLRFPQGGTGTRALLFVERGPGSYLSCQYDSLLSCNP